MKIIVIGLGSMGKRRIRLMKSMYSDYTILGVDGRDDRRAEAESLLNIKTYKSIADAKSAEEIDCAFVCTSPLSHSVIINECLNNGWNVFTEINLVADGYAENIELAKQKSKTLFLSSTNLYNEEVKFIKKQVLDSDKWNYVYHVGQYLPDWHPWENYKDFFISNKKTNGCREILAIELPWLTKTFGEIKEFNVLKNKNTDLDIDFNDNYIVQFRHENGNKGVFIVDVVTPVPMHFFEAYGENKYLTWNGTPESLKVFDNSEKALKNVELTYDIEHMEGYADFIIENDYKNEIKEFFDVVLGNKKAVYTFEDDLQVLKLIDDLEA